jgi:hypothetical protein
LGPTAVSTVSVGTNFGNNEESQAESILKALVVRSAGSSEPDLLDLSPDTEETETQTAVSSDAVSVGPVEPGITSMGSELERYDHFLEPSQPVDL